jgi:hypothetical protein
LAADVRTLRFSVKNHTRARNYSPTGTLRDAGIAAAGL